MTLVHVFFFFLKYVTKGKALCALPPSRIQHCPKRLHHAVTSLEPVCDSSVMAPVTCWFSFNYRGEPREITAGAAIFRIDSAAATVWEPAHARPDLTQWKKWKPKADGFVRGEAKCTHQIPSYELLAHFSLCTGRMPKSENIPIS